ncbi:hypothetical protein A6F68_01843 [Tsuneonella dongtanensis]|uniref:Lipoprotein n=1 Tax=Tsuneonella dongtanensis TaxID=692370 RepID=A0A1B2ADY7_9SPHN|nr:hypothetical protein [Tsuneonella dongtanensis]ANY20353.1 hypothetical protein A6F68_01843 [Tsuneonella dongtanensis]
MRKSLLVVSLLALAACTEKAPSDSEEAAAPATTAATSPAPADREEEDIRQFLLQEYPDATPMQYALAWRDLNGDGAEEAIVHLVSSYFCGTGGCNTLVLTPAGPMWSKVAEISVSRTPVTVLDSKTNGWNDLTVSIAGGGGPAGIALLKHDGKSYPSNPTVPPAEIVAEAGTEVITEDPVLVKLEGEKPSGG